MRLPAPLLRHNPRVHKNTFGHVLILAGSPRMLGAAALSTLAAMRSGAGLVTLGLPRSLNNIAQKKISHVVMTLPLPETNEHTISQAAFQVVQKYFDRYSAIAIGPGLTTHPGTKKFIHQVIVSSPVPLVIDADALNTLVGHCDLLDKNPTQKILTPHPGEWSRLIHQSKRKIEDNRQRCVKDFIQKYPSCTLLLKGHRTLVCQKGKKTYLNTTGNAGMATAGSGDVLTGMIAAFLAQGLESFEAAKWGAHLHGLAGDLALKRIPAASLIATDLIEYLPTAIQKAS